MERAPQERADVAGVEPEVQPGGQADLSEERGCACGRTQDVPVDELDDVLADIAQGDGRFLVLPGPGGVFGQSPDDCLDQGGAQRRERDEPVGAVAEGDGRPPGQVGGEFLALARTGPEAALAPPVFRVLQTVGDDLREVVVVRDEAEG
ncbi:hypothetical protein ACFUCT_34165 [Streptomyces parvus]|uniref:hypothetical protein n=1 Tax=Streptomyces TaxID=1883 RepID=UPI00131DF91E|nr:hypothetical protein [Streptomyces sp. CB02613]